MKTTIMNQTALLILASLFFAFVTTSCSEPTIEEIVEEVEEVNKPLLEVERVIRTISTKSATGEDLQLSPTGAPIDLIGTFVNTGKSDALLSIRNDSTLRIVIPVGQMQIVEVSNLKTMKVIPLGEGGCTLDASIYHAPAQNNPGGKFDLKAWDTEVCGGGIGVYHPEDPNQCLFEQVTVWSSATPRLVQMDIHVIGKTDLEVEIEFEGHTFSSFKAYAPPATPVHQSVTGEFDKVIAVRIRGEKNPVNGCAPLRIEGQLCYQ